MLNKKDIIYICKLAMENDFDLEEYDYNQIEINFFFDKIYKADQKRKIIKENNIEVIRCLIKLPVKTKEDKKEKYYKQKLEEGKEIKYFPWGYELHIYPDGWIKYTDGTTNSFHYPNSIKISNYLFKKGYPLI